MRTIIGLTMAGIIGSLVIGNLMHITATIQAALNTIVIGL